MTVPEYIQLRAFARIDGARLSLLWIASFACYIWGLKTPELGLLSIGLAVATPFYCTRRLRRFTTEVLEGSSISFGRGYVYVVFMLFYACLLFAAVQFIYFTYMDKGFFVESLTSVLNEASTQSGLGSTAMGTLLQEGIEALRNMRVIDLVLNILMSNMMIGALAALPVAAVGRRSRNK